MADKALSRTNAATPGLLARLFGRGSLPKGDPRAGSGRAGGVFQSARETSDQARAQIEAEEASARASGRLITVGRRSFAVNLDWRLAGDDESVDVQARRMARVEQPPFDFVAILSRTQGQRYPQVGMGRADGGLSWRTPSLIGALMGLGASWAGSFPVELKPLKGEKKDVKRPEEVYWTGIVQDGIVMVDSLSTADEARNLILEKLGSGAFQRLYAPRDFNVPGAVDLDLGLALEESTGTPVRLEYVNRTWPAFRLGAGIIGAAVALFFAPGLLMSLVPAPEAPPALLPPPPPKIWEAAARPLDWYRGCQGAMDRAPAIYLGWKLTSVICDGSQVIVDWTREGDSVTYIPDGFVLEANAARGRQIWPVAPANRRGHEDLWDRATVTQFLLSLAPEAQWTAHVDAPVVSAPAGAQLPKPPPVAFQRRDLVFNGVRDIRGPIRMMDSIPGAVLTAISMTADGTAKIEGAIYEAR